MMRYFVLILLFVKINVYGQAPENISYQTVIRNEKNELLQNKAVSIRISLLQGGVEGDLVFQEVHTVTTNLNGLAYLIIGKGSPVIGKIAGINWAKGNIFIKSETDPDGGKDYKISMVTQVLSVPYALHANSADKLNYEITEKDPEFSKSVAKAITSQDTTRWNRKIGTEVDPLYRQSVAAGVTAQDTTRWNSKIGTEVDPLYRQSVAAGVTAQDTTRWNKKIGSETDPLYRQSVAAGVTSQDTTRWNSKIGSETDPLYRQSVASAITSKDTMRWNNQTILNINNIQTLIDTLEKKNVVLNQKTPSYLRYFGSGADGSKICTNDEVLNHNSNFNNLVIPENVTVKVTPAITSTIYVKDTLFLYGTIDGSGEDRSVSTMNGENNHIGATASGAESSQTCYFNHIGGSENLEFKWSTSQQPESYFVEMGGILQKNSGRIFYPGSCFSSLCTSTDGSNLEFQDLTKIIHFGLDISGVNGAAIKHYGGDSGGSGCKGVLLPGGQGGAGLYLIANNIVLNGSIKLSGGNGGSYNCGSYSQPSRELLRSAAGGGGSLIISTNNLISNNLQFTANGGVQKGITSCDRKGGDGNFIILVKPI